MIIYKSVYDARERSPNKRSENNNVLDVRDEDCSKDSEKDKQPMLVDVCPKKINGTKCGEVFNHVLMLGLAAVSLFRRYQ